MINQFAKYHHFCTTLLELYSKMLFDSINVVDSLKPAIHPSQPESFFSKSCLYTSYSNIAKLGLFYMALTCPTPANQGWQNFVTIAEMFSTNPKKSLFLIEIIERRLEFKGFSLERLCPQSPMEVYNSQTNITSKKKYGSKEILDP